MLSGARSGWPIVARRLRLVLGLEAASLWSIDRRGGLLVKEAFDAETLPSEEQLRVDEQLTHTQLASRRLMLRQPARIDAAVPERPLLPAPSGAGAISLPVAAEDGTLVAVLNLYSAQPSQWYFDAARAAEAEEFFRSVAGQIAFFIGRKALESNTTFYKEMHHRVKNNLQTVASLLRMQLRRLDRQSAERALEDSIARIESIAVVHETLSQGDIGLVDLGALLQRIAALASAGIADAPRITLRLDGPPIMLTSKQATTLALVANELVQNALRHGVARGGSRIDVALERNAGRVRLEVVDDGAGLPPGFDPQGDGNLGLTIVRTLTTELSGEFALEPRGAFTVASLSFPESSLGPALESA